MIVQNYVEFWSVRFWQSDLINCGQHKDESLDERHSEEVGAVIDKNGLDIEAIREAVHYQIGCLLVFLLHIASLREMSKTKVEVSKRKDYGERRVIRLEGAERKVAFSKAMGQNEEETSRKSAPKSLNSEGFALPSK